MPQSILITYISPGNLTWASSDSGDGTFANGTASTVGSAGQAAVAQVKLFLANKGANATAMGSGIA